MCFILHNPAKAAQPLSLSLSYNDDTLQYVTYPTLDMTWTLVENKISVLSCHSCVCKYYIIVYVYCGNGH